MAITTPPVRVSYPNLFKAKSVFGGKPTFSITLMFAKQNKEHMECLKKIVAEAEQAKKDKWPDPTKAPRIPIVGNDKSPVKDADKNCDSQGIPMVEKNPEYAGHYIIRASKRAALVNRLVGNNESNGPFFEADAENSGLKQATVYTELQGKPVTVDRNNQEISDPGAIYGGCFCKVNINAYAYDRDVNKGVTFGLNGVQFWEKAESFGTAQLTPDEMFGEASSEDPNSYKNGDLFGDNAVNSDNPF